VHGLSLCQRQIDQSLFASIVRQVVSAWARRYRRRLTCGILSNVQCAVLVVFLALLTFNVSGLAALCDDAPCDESCPTDASGGQCPPNCHFCSCCSLPKVTGSARVALLIPPEQATSWICSSDRPFSPEPADILHVPKLLLA